MTNKDVAKKLLRYVVGYFVKTGFPAIALKKANNDNDLILKKVYSDSFTNS